MNEAQITYITLKTLQETAKAQVWAAMEPHDHLLETEDGIDTYTDIEMKIFQKFNLRQIENKLFEAETNLIEWAINKIRRDPVAAAHLGDIDAVYQASKRHIGIREKLLDVSARLQN